MVLAALETLLTSAYDVVGTVSDGRAVVAAAEALQPDVVVLDVGMPLLNGLDAARQIRQALPNAKLVFVTMHEDAEVAAEALRAGASGYVLKRSAAAELIMAINEALAGRCYITPLAMTGLVDALAHPERGRDPQVALTPRQREILQALSEGNSMKEVAARLDITPRTVAFHKYAMMQVLSVKTTAELIRYAIDHHIV